MPVGEHARGLQKKQTAVCWNALCGRRDDVFRVVACRQKSFQAARRVFRALAFKAVRQQQCDANLC